MARSFKRKEQIAIYTPSSQGVIPLSRNYHMQRLMVKLSIVHTNTKGVEFTDNGVLGLINNIEVVANGNQNLKQIPATKIVLNNVLSSEMAGLSNIDKSIKAGAKSYAWFTVDFSMTKMVRPADTILNTGLFSTFDFIINWGSDASIGKNINVTSAKIEVSSDSLVNYQRNKKETISYFKETASSTDVTSTTDEMTIELPVNKLYSQLAIVAETDKKRTNAVIKRVKVKSGTNVFVDWDFETLQAFNNLTFKPENKNLLKGTAIVNFVGRDRMSDLLDTIRDFNTLEIVLSVEKPAIGITKILVFSDTVEPTNIVEVK